MESETASGTNTGIAVMNLTNEDLMVDLELFNNNARLATGPWHPWATAPSYWMPSSGRQKLQWF